MKQVMWSQTVGRPAVYLAFLMVLVGWILPADLLAVPITYTEQTVTDGFLLGTQYSFGSTTITFSGDTGNVTGSLGTFTNAIGTATVTVAGVGTDTFTDSIEVFFIQGLGQAGIRDLSNNTNIIDTFGGPPFLGYTLSTAIGPITGANGSRTNVNIPFGTSSGVFVFTSASVPSTFTATLTGAVPQPTSLSLLGLGMLGMVGLRVLRRKKAV